MFNFSRLYDFTVYMCYRTVIFISTGQPSVEIKI